MLSGLSLMFMLLGWAIFLDLSPLLGVVSWCIACVLSLVDMFKE